MAASQGIIKTTQADGLRAYLQALLKSKHKTWVTIPYELWPESWKKRKMRKPVCLLQKSLYGHPESGGHWERHCTAAIIKCGGQAVENHPSTFWFPDERMLMNVYVDDFLLSGPEAGHDILWRRLRDPKHGNIQMEDPEPLDRFLGRSHPAVP